MGVKGLWQLLEPVGRPVTLESLEGKVLSVAFYVKDASILLNQAVKGMRDKSGNPLPNAHLVVLFTRLCKLLFYKIKPIFVFDGGVPVLKKKTLAMRRERKFKARHGTNKAAEKLVKNYLKGKALETVTGRKSQNAVLGNKGPRDPDIFELPPMSKTQERMQELSSSSEGEEDTDDTRVLQQLYGQHEFEKKFQDPLSINVDSEDFRSLPEEIQHELIKDIMEEKKWSTMDSMPQDAFSFSDYQLQNVLQRGKLHQRLDELRKEMNNRNNGEVSGLSSQDIDADVQSQRIVSEDSGHYVLVKTSKNNGNENQDSLMVDNLTEGGFFREEGVVSSQQTKSSSHPRVPSFHVDVDCEKNSDSEGDSALLEVPEVIMLDLDMPRKKGKGNFRVDVERKIEASSGDGWTEVNAEELNHQKGNTLGKNNQKTTQIGENRLDRKNEKSLVIVEEDAVDKKEERRTTVEETLNDLRLNKDETENSESIKAQIKQRRNQIEMLLKKRQLNLSSLEDASEKTVQDRDSADNLSTVEENNEGSSVAPADGDTIEFRLYLESSSDEDETREELEKSDKDRTKDIQVVQDVHHEDQEKSKASEDLEESSEITDKSAEMLLEAEGRKEEELEINTGEDQSSESKGNPREDKKGKEEEDEDEDEEKMLNTGEDQDSESKGNAREDEKEKEKEEEYEDEDEDEEKMLNTGEDQDSESKGNARKEEKEREDEDEEKEGKEDEEKEKEEDMEIQTASHEEENLASDDKPTEPDTRLSLVPTPSEFSGTSKEDLEVMQVKLEMEQQSLQTEKARQERMAATLSSEMLTESQELLRLFGVPYVVSPMEAEAQCAFLDFTNQTSGTITDDSDIFLFGGTRVYKHIFNQKKHAEVYTIDAITGHLALDRSKMINLAFITGSDYTEGIQGLGAVGAMEVLHEFKSDGFQALLKFKKWHDETKNNKNSTQETKVKQKLRTLTLPTGFPSKEVLDSYVNPVIDESREEFEWGKPDLHSLRLFAREKLGWTVAKTDEILLPVLKQMNQQETQMRMDDFFRIKFHEPRKKSSKRVRRVINRFLNPLSSSESSSEDEGKNKPSSKSANKMPGDDSQSISQKGRGKGTGSRKKVAVPRGTRGRGRAQSRGRGTGANRLNRKELEDERPCDRDDNDRSVTSNERVELDTIVRDDHDDKEGRGSRLTDRKHKKEGRKIEKRKGGKGRRNVNTQQKGKGYIINKVNDGADLLKPQGDHNTKTPNNLFSDVNNDCDQSIVGIIERNNVNNQKYKIPKNKSPTSKEKSSSLGRRNINEDSSTSSDSDSEEERMIRSRSGNIRGRGFGRKRTRGRGGTVKRSKIEK